MGHRVLFTRVLLVVKVTGRQKWRRCDGCCEQRGKRRIASSSLSWV